MERRAYFYFLNTSCFISLIFLIVVLLCISIFIAISNLVFPLAGISYQALLACKLPDLYGDKNLLFTALL